MTNKGYEVVATRIYCKLTSVFRYVTPNMQCRNNSLIQFLLSSHYYITQTCCNAQNR